MILSDKSGGPRPRPKPAGSASDASDRPVPKATCPACARPVASLKNPKCVYCGAAIPQSLRGDVPMAAPQAIPAEMLVMLEPRGRDDDAVRQRWLVRGVAVAIAGVLIMVCIRIFSPHS